MSGERSHQSARAVKNVYTNASITRSRPRAVVVGRRAIARITPADATNRIDQLTLFSTRRVIHGTLIATYSSSRCDYRCRDRSRTLPEAIL